MKIVRRVMAMFLTTALFMAPQTQATTNDDIDSAKGLLKEIRAETKQLKKLLKKSKVYTAISSSSLAAKFKDSDGDDSPDILEGIKNTGACDADSDDDGIDDGIEAQQGSNPNDSGEGEVELKGTISAIDSQTVTVGSFVCTATAQTDFNDGSSLANYTIGNFVEISCELQFINGVKTLALRSIKFENS